MLGLFLVHLCARFFPCTMIYWRGLLQALSGLFQQIIDMCSYTYNTDRFHGCLWFLPQNEYASGAAWNKLRKGHVGWRFNHQNIQYFPFRPHGKIKRHLISLAALPRSGRTSHRALHPPHVLSSVGFHAILSFGHPTPVAPSWSLLLFLLVSLSSQHHLLTHQHLLTVISKGWGHKLAPEWSRASYLASLPRLPWAISIADNSILEVAWAINPHITCHNMFSLLHDTTSLALPSKWTQSRTLCPPPLLPGCVNFLHLLLVTAGAFPLPPCVPTSSPPHLLPPQYVKWPSKA